jgi:hypothetical protein
MPELSILPSSGISIPAINLDPSRYFDRTPLPAPVVDTSRLAAAQGKAALFGSIADTLAKLPETLIGAYQAGKKLATGNATTNAYNAALAGNPVAGTTLADFKATGDGAVTFSQEKPEDAEMRRLKIEALKRAGVPKPSFYEEELKSAMPRTGVPASTPASPGAADTTTVDPTDSDSLDYLDAYGKVKTADPLNPTDEERSAGLLPPDGFQPTPKPNFRTGAPVPLSQLSDFQPSAVTPEDRAAIEGAATSIGQQLTAIQPESALGASEGATPAAAITPVSREQALATFEGTQPNKEGFSMQESGSKTVDPSTGVITLKTDDGREFVLTPGGHGYQEVKPRGGAPTVPAMIRSEAIRMGVYKDGMTAEQVSDAMSHKMIDDGIIPPSQRNNAMAFAKSVVSHPALKHYPVIREAKETVDAGLANQGTGGFSDMALVEGFQRMVNPGATVRTQTMQQMLKAAGFGQYADLGFLMDHFKEGDKFAPEVRQRLKKLSDDIFQRATKNAEPQLKALGEQAKMFGIPNPQKFVELSMRLAPLMDVNGTPEVPGSSVAPTAAPVAGAGMVKMRAPDGTTQYVKPEAVPKYQAKGATVVP